MNEKWKRKSRKRCRQTTKKMETLRMESERHGWRSGSDRLVPAVAILVRLVTFDWLCYSAHHQPDHDVTWSAHSDQFYSPKNFKSAPNLFEFNQIVLWWQFIQKNFFKKFFHVVNVTDVSCCVNAALRPFFFLRWLPQTFRDIFFVIFYFPVCAPAFFRES